MEKWPQPHEGVAGVDRTEDDLLSLSGPAMNRRVVILSIARELWVSALNGAHLEHGRALYDRMQYPKTGDLVVETVGLTHPAKLDADGEARAVTCFGILLGQRTEWACSDERWQQYREDGETEGYPVPDESRVTTQASYIQYGPSADDVCRWVNCSIIALPTELLHHAPD